MRLFLPLAFTAGCLGLAAAPADAANLLDSAFPRGKQACYTSVIRAKVTRAGTARAITMLRLTRPLRFQTYDTTDTRVVRVVINFAGTDKPRIEDSLTCKDSGGRLICQSTTCDGTGFDLTQGTNGGLTLQQDKASPNVIWSCEQDAIRDIVLADEELALALHRGSGSCLD